MQQKLLYLITYVYDLSKKKKTYAYEGGDSLKLNFLMLRNLNLKLIFPFFYLKFSFLLILLPTKSKAYFKELLCHVT